MSVTREGPHHAVARMRALLRLARFASRVARAGYASGSSLARKRSAFSWHMRAISGALSP